MQRDKRQGGKLYKHLWHDGRGYRKGGSDKQVIIPNRINIEKRPEIVDTKKRFGDWEVDTVLGKQGTGARVNLVERKSKMYLIRKVPPKSAEDLCRAIIDYMCIRSPQTMAQSFMRMRVLLKSYKRKYISQIFMLLENVDWMKILMVSSVNIFQKERISELWPIRRLRRCKGR